MSDDPSSAHMSDEEFRRIETRWKSDVDKRLSDGAGKMDRLLEFASKYEAHLEAQLKHAQELSLLRRAIIEKSLVALIWAMIAGAAALIWSGAKAWVLSLR